jgi:hypothetical protein
MGENIGTENRVKDFKTAFKPTPRQGFSGSSIFSFKAFRLM